jgi:hypothetical protein
VKIIGSHYKNRRISVYVMAMLSLSVLVFSLNNNVSVSMVASGTSNNGSINNNEVKNRTAINDVSNQIANSNTGADKEQVQQVLQQILRQIAQRAGENETTNAINQISSIIQLNPRGALAQSLLFLAKQQASGNTNAVTQVAIKVAARISSGDDDLGKSFPQDVEQLSKTTYENSSAATSDKKQEELIHNADTDRTTTNTPSGSDQSITEGIGEEPDTDEKEATALERGEARTLATLPDYTPFISNECDGSLDKFVPNPFISSIDSTRFQIGGCITVVGEVIWTHYINTDGDANFNVKLDSKYNSLLTPANNSPTFNGAIHVEVVCQGPNNSKDPIKVNQCKNPEYNGPIFYLPRVGTRVQVTGTYLLDANEGGHAEIHPAYNIILNPTSSPLPPTPIPAPTPLDNSPIADAGHSRPDQTVNAGSQVTLDGRASRNPNNSPLTFTWIQMSGPTVQLSTPNQATTSFTAPSNLQADTKMSFILTVTNSSGVSDKDIVSILVRHSTTTTNGTPYQSGYDHGCSDAKLPFSKRYINQSGKGPQYHTQEFISGYNAGFSACS